MRSYPYRIMPSWKEELKEKVMKLLKQNIMKPSQSPWSSPMVPVCKPNRSSHLCIDYRMLNLVTMVDPHGMPQISNLLDEVAESCWLSKHDLNQCFYQIPMDQDSIAKTAFCSPWGKFAFTHMHSGLKNAPATLQRYMDVALWEQSGFCSTFEQYLEHIDAVLSALKAADLTA